MFWKESLDILSFIHHACQHTMQGWKVDPLHRICKILSFWNEKLNTGIIEDLPPLQLSSNTGSRQLDKLQAIRAFATRWTAKDGRACAGLEDPQGRPLRCDRHRPALRS